ncbi:MAG: glycosyltransferase family 2 protein [Muribaculum sp.]|nr:glycosyltransferase family 2 protein [Muribaculum sp.]
MNTNNNIMISIIVPIYNVKDYLTKCIESIINQTYQNLEIILVDDGSTDGSGQICDAYAEKDSRIVVIHKQNDGTVVSARKVGAKAATGDYVIGVDGDDWIGSTRIETLVAQGTTSDADMIYLNGRHIQWGDEYTLEEPDIRCGVYSSKEICSYLQDTDACFIRRIFPLMGCWGIKRDLNLRIQMMLDNRIFTSSDQVFFWLCLLEAQKIVVLRETGYYYVMRESSITHVAGRCTLQSILLVYQSIKEGLDRHHCDIQMYKRLLFMTTRMLLETDYDIFYRHSSDFLYPYSSIKEGSRIIVYGAGLTGIRLMQSITKDNRYSVAAWIDMNVRDKEVGGFCPCSPEHINSVNYDYIAIAIQDAAVSRKVKTYLLEMNIAESKIACMDPKVINQDMLETCLNSIAKDTVM